MKIILLATTIASFFEGTFCYPPRQSVPSAFAGMFAGLGPPRFSSAKARFTAILTAAILIWYC